eukprot:CAMPEP_0170545910 /NCGR_PEP_ID=MMETSP0211-20121228/4273_1 /TAXON_ID=311385 /ORGANISM="Pseudokeronopsis sp., Strain OXSARD2" /LENGTH=57 /DNA_ID=CAMNT_0010850067 /DNA_START=380 /DNA_END=553 /DNA_ORIENTATION=+
MELNGKYTDTTTDNQTATNASITEVPVSNTSVPTTNQSSSNVANLEEEPTALSLLSL